MSTPSPSRPQRPQLLISARGVPARAERRQVPRRQPGHADHRRRGRLPGDGGHQEGLRHPQLHRRAAAGAVQEHGRRHDLRQHAVEAAAARGAGRGGRHRGAGPGGGAAWSGRGRAAQGPHQAPHQGRIQKSDLIFLS